MAYEAITTTYYETGNFLCVCDPIHGKYHIKPPYTKIVATKEMQRLKEITQTGFSFYDYPNMKYEDRLAHSLGAYHIMEKILNKLSLLLKNTNVKISKDDREVALCAILLHDIGHGPFSHSFEAISNYSHEKRTTDILLGDTEVNKVLTEEFGIAKVRRIASFIAEIDSENKDNAFVDTAFSRLIKSLISHQIDADRLDYLVRDAYYAGIETSINIDKIISAISIAMNAQGDFEIIMDKKNLTLIETPLIERFQHYRDIYFTYGSVIGDRLFKELLFVMRENRDGKLEELISKEFIELIVDPENLSLDDFLLITDTKVNEFLDLVSKESRNPVIRRLAMGKKTIENFMIFEDTFVKDKLTDLMKQISRKDVSLKYSCYEIFGKTKFYKKDEGFKIRSNQSIVDLTDVTNLVNARDYVEMKCTVFNPEIFYFENKLSSVFKSKNAFLAEVKKRIGEIHLKEQEFELKYICPSTRSGINVANDILSMLLDSFQLEKERNFINHDYYYDNDKFDLYKGGKILRIREKSKKKIGTYKEPLNTGDIYTSRTEIEEELSGADFNELVSKMKDRGVILPDGINNLPLLEVVNNRSEYILKKGEGKVCFCIDDVCYVTLVSNSKTIRYSEIMIEIEAYNDMQDRFLLTEINNLIWDYVSRYKLDVEITHDSKYSRGMNRVIKEG